MSEYLHGTYGETGAVGSPVAIESKSAYVAVGTAPVGQLAQGAKSVNKPIVVKNMAEARKYFGYSSDWAKYTLCETFHVFFEQRGYGPLVVINVLNPTANLLATKITEEKTPDSGSFSLDDADLIDKDTIVVTGKTLGTDYTVTLNSTNNTYVIAEKTEGSLGTSALAVAYDKYQPSTANLTPRNGKASITNAEDVILSTIVVSRTTGEGNSATTTTFVLGTDYTLEYNYAKKTVEITILPGGSIGTTAFDVAYNKTDPTAVDDSVLIGTSDGLGANTGLQCVKDVYALTGMIPAFLLCPGFSSSPTVHTAMYEVSQKVNGHWDMFMYADLPLMNGSTPLTLDTVNSYKNSNGYNKDNEKVFFPMILGTDDKKYHLSVLAAAALLEVTADNDDIPYHSSSNMACPVIQNLYLGETNTDRVYDDQMINEKLNQYGICSAAFVGGRWVIWGAHCASYTAAGGERFNISETNCMMLYYISNDFQHRRMPDVDQPLTRNDVDSIRAEEQARLDALRKIGALIYGTVSANASEDARSDLLNGDHVFTFEVTNTPLARSLKAIVNWVETGFETYFDTGEEGA